MKTCGQCGRDVSREFAHDVTFLPGEQFCDACFRAPTVATVQRERDNLAKAYYKLQNVEAQCDDLKAMLDRYARRAHASCGDASIEAGLSLAAAMDAEGPMSQGRASVVRALAHELRNERECCEYWIERARLPAC